MAATVEKCILVRVEFVGFVDDLMSVVSSKFA